MRYLLGLLCELDVTVIKCNWRRVLRRELLKLVSLMTRGLEVFANRKQSPADIHSKRQLFERMAAVAVSEVYITPEESWQSAFPFISTRHMNCMLQVV